MAEITEQQDTKTAAPVAPVAPEETGPQTDLSTQNQPAGTTRIEDGVAYGADGKPLGQANEQKVPTTPQQAASQPKKVDYEALAKQFGSVGSEPKPPVDYAALAKQYGAVGSSPNTPETPKPVTPQEQTYDLLTRAIARGHNALVGKGAIAPLDSAGLAQAKNVSDYIYNNILRKEDYHHNNLTYDPTPTGAWEKIKQRLWGWATQDEINKIPGLEPDRVQMLREQGQDALTRLIGGLSESPLAADPALRRATAGITPPGAVTAQQKAEYLREHILDGSYAINVPPEEFARAAAKSVTDFFSPGYYALGAFGRVGQAYQKAAQVEMQAGNMIKAAQLMGKARLAGLLGTGINVPFAASQAHDLLENWDRMSIPERVASVAGILGASINTHVGVQEAGGYKQVASDVAQLPVIGAKKVAGALDTALGRTNDFETAVFRAGETTKKQKAGLRESISNVSPDLQAILNQNPGAENPEQFAKAIDTYLKSREQVLQGRAGNAMQANTEVVSGFESRLRAKLDKVFAENKGRFGQADVDAAKQELLDRLLQEETISPGLTSLRGPNLFEAENARQGLNEEVKPQYNTNAKPTTDAYKFGAKHAADFLREAIDENYDAQGVKGVKEFRSKEADLINVKTALENAVERAKEMGQPGLWDALVKKYGAPSTITAIVLGTHNPLAFGALAPYLMTYRAYHNVKNPNLNTNRAVELAAQNPNAKAIDLTINPTGPTPPPTPPPTGTPTGPTAPTSPPVPGGKTVPPVTSPQSAAQAAHAATPATLEAPPVDHALNAALATHYQEPMEHTSYDNRLQRFHDDVEAARRTNTPLTPQQGKILAQINDVKAQYDAKVEKEQQKAAEEAHTQLTDEHAAHQDELQKYAEKIAKQQAEEKGPLAVNQTAVTEGAPLETTDEELPNPAGLKAIKSNQPSNTRIHELGHMVVSHMMNLPGVDVISHLHEDAEPGTLAEARSDIDRLRNPDGSLDKEKVKANLGDLITRYTAGGIAEELYGGVPFDENETTASDLVGLTKMFHALGITGPDVARITEQAKAQAREMLTSPAAEALINKYAPKRIAGMDDRYHFDEPTTKRMFEEFDKHGENNGKETEGNNPAPVGGGTREVGKEPVAGREGASTPELATRQKAGLVERTTGKPEIDEAIKAGGGIPAGKFEHLAMFHSPETGSTLAFPADKITPEAVRDHIQKSNESFGVKTKQQLVREHAADHDEVLENMKRAYGVSNDPKDMNYASFISPEGEYLHLPSGIQHNDAIYENGGPAGSKANGFDNRKAFMNDTGVVRVHTGRERAGDVMTFSVPKNGVTPDQAEAMAQMFGAKGNRNGLLRIERTDITPENKNEASADKEFPRPSDVAPMLRQISALPKAGLKTKQSFTTEKHPEAVADEPEETMHMSVEGKKAGSIGYFTDADGNVNISSAHIEPELRNQGLGQQLYQELFDRARQQGANRVNSDASLTPDARNMWDGLVRKGIAKKDENNLYHVDLRTKQTAVTSHAADAADKFNEERGRDAVNATGILHNPETAKRIADEYDKLQHNPNDPEVKKAYGAAVKDINDQWDYAQDKMGMKFEPWTKEGQPYANSKEMKADVDNNHHLYFFTGGELPADHPLAQVDPKTGYTYNDKLRAVHDLFGHAAHGFQFGPKGEENAWNVHRQMFSPEAIPAITTETRGQNSWVNFGKHLRDVGGNVPNKGEAGYVPPTERPYAANKAAILPEELHTPQHWSESVANNLDREPAGGINPNNPNEPSKRYGYEIAPEVRKPLESNPTAKDFADYAKEPQVQNLLQQHPDVKLGWDTTGPKPELNVGATTNDLAKAKENAAKLDQRSLWDNAEKKEIPVGGKGERTAFPEYPIDQRLGDLRTKQTKALSPKAQEMIDKVKEEAYATYPLDEIKSGDPWLSQYDRDRGEKPGIDHADAGFLHPDGSISMIESAYMHDPFLAALGDDFNQGKFIKATGSGTFDMFDERGHGAGSPRTFSLTLGDKPTPEQVQAIASMVQHLREGSPDFRTVDVEWPGTHKVIDFATPGKVVQELGGDDLSTKQTAVKASYPENPEGFEHIHPELLADMEPDEREFVKGDKRKQKAIEQAYNEIGPSREETKAAIEAGQALGGWWQRFIDTFKALGQTDEAAQIEKLGPEHAEALKAWHSAVSGNKSVQDANRTAWGTYADWLDAGRPKDRPTINKIVAANGKPKGNAAISDTTRRGKVIHAGLDTSKLFSLINSPQMRDVNPEPFHGSVYDPNNPSPVAGVSNGARKIPSMAATVAGEGNLNRLVLDAHMLDFYGQNGWTDNKYIAHSIHLRQAAKELGLQGGEGQEQIWGTVLGIKQLLREGVPPSEVPDELTNDVVNSIGKDYAEIIKEDPELYAIFNQLKKHGLDPGGNAAQQRLADITANKPAAKEARTDKSLLANIAERIKGKMKNLPEELNASFNFGHNTPDLKEGLDKLAGK